MAFTHFAELPGESGTVNGSFQTSYTKTFAIVSDNALDTVFNVGSHPNLPRLYDAHPADPRAYCVSINPQQDSDNPYVWRVSCQWSMALDSAGMGGMPTATGNPMVDSQQAGKAPSDRQSAPLARGNDYSYETVSVRKEYVETDTVTLKPIANTAGDRPTSLPERESFALQVTIGRNLPGAPSSEWDALCGKLNRNQVTIGTRVCAPRTVMMMSTSATLVYEAQTSYWRWTHRVIIKDAADWKWRILSKGYNGILPFKAGPVAAIEYKKAQIARHFKNLTGEQLLDKDGYVVKAFPDGARTPHTLAFDYLLDDTFPSVL